MSGSKEVIKEIIKINKKIKKGTEDGTISYENYSQTVKPFIEAFKKKHKQQTPNKYLKRYIEPFLKKLQENSSQSYEINNFQHYGNRNLYNFVWACIYLKIEGVGSLFASHSPQLYILVHDNGVKFGFDYGAKVNSDSEFISKVKQNELLKDQIIEITKDINIYNIGKGSDNLPTENQKIKIQEKSEFDRLWSNNVHIIRQYKTSDIPADIDVEINHVFSKLLPLFKQITGFKSIKSELFSGIKEFSDAIEHSCLIYSNEKTTRFTSSLITKPFLILTGLTGSGKTKLAQAFVKWISESKEQYKIIPVGADWTNREPLLGFPNGLNKKEYILPDSEALQIMLAAQKEENQNKPYFIILDEMNLSHVERYFADFLSIMESKDTIKLYSGEQRYSEFKEGDEDFNRIHEIPKEIGWPKNLFIIGTVNIDETTYMFSPKVLDRANVIEFRINASEMKDYLDNSGELKLEELHVDKNKANPGLGAQYGESFVSLASNNEPNEVEVSVLNKFFEELQEVGAEFGYRSASEIKLLISNLSKNDAFIEDYLKDQLNKQEISPDDLLNHKLDIAIMQKLLPKLHGSRKKLVKPLDKLASLCIEPSLNRKNEESEKDKSHFSLFLSDSAKESIDMDVVWIIKYPISFEKIKRMHKNLLENGFVSYAEA